MESFTLVIADDHRLVLLSLREYLAPHEDVVLVGEAVNGAQVLPIVAQTGPDVVLLDVRMPQMDGLVCLQQLRRRFPEVRVVIFSAFLDAATVARARELDADGIVDKNVAPDELLDLLRRVARGERVVSTERPEEAWERAGLTARELSVLSGVSRGLSNRKIARELWLSEQTIKFHLGNVYRKLEVANRTEAVHVAYSLGLVQSPVFEQSS